MDFYRLQVFRVVAKHLSYSKAARELFISQPAVSKHVHTLERELGEKLILQFGRTLRLTDAGCLAYDYAQRAQAIAEEMELALRELRDLERGTLKIGTSDTPGLYLLPESLSRFHHRHPGVAVSVDISNSSQVVYQVLRREVDVGFVGSGNLPPEAHVLPLIMDEVVLIASPAHPLGVRGRVALSALNKVVVVAREPGSGTRKEAEEALAKREIGPRVVLELKGTEAVKRAVAANLGVAFVSRQAIVHEEKAGELRVVRIDDFEIWRPISVISLKGARPSPAVLTFTAELQKSIGRGRLRETGVAESALRLL